ncbi:MAG: cytochrome c biogenesis CcdA family protein [Myxococcota bacterium]|nr:cytochrome c biogenesis CcdA family protein [Myxococcota bacterium]
MQEGLSIATFGAAFGAGLISVLSPCVMPLMPAYLSLISGISVDEMRDDVSPDLRRRILLGCTGFVAGFSTIFILLGASATVVGHVLQTWRVEIGGFEVSAVQIAGLVIIAMGLHLMGWLPIPALYRDTRFQGAAEPRGFLGTYLVGAAFAFGWSPCVGPILGGILTIAASRETVGAGMALLAVYSLGLGLPFFLAGWSIEFFFRALGRMRRHFRTLELVSGGLLVALGVLVVSNRLALLNDYFGFLNTVVEKAESWLL